MYCKFSGQVAFCLSLVRSGSFQTAFTHGVGS